MNKRKELSAMPVTVRFHAGIRSDGEIVRVTLEQAGNTVLLTDEQIIALIKQLGMRRGGSV